MLMLKLNVVMLIIMLNVTSALRLAISLAAYNLYPMTIGIADQGLYIVAVDLIPSFILGE
jgi:hypothetical protein